MGAEATGAGGGGGGSSMQAGAEAWPSVLAAVSIATRQQLSGIEHANVKWRSALSRRLPRSGEIFGPLGDGGGRRWQCGGANMMMIMKARRCR